MIKVHNREGREKIETVRWIFIAGRDAPWRDVNSFAIDQNPRNRMKSAERCSRVNIPEAGSPKRANRQWDFMLGGIFCSLRNSARRVHLFLLHLPSLWYWTIKTSRWSKCWCRIVRRIHPSQRAKATVIFEESQILKCGSTRNPTSKVEKMNSEKCQYFSQLEEFYLKFFSIGNSAIIDLLYLINCRVYNYHERTIGFLEKDCFSRTHVS